jgi:hypothetical protein
MNNYLEDEYRPAFESWQANQTPEGNAAFMQSIHPIVQKGIQMYGGDSPLSASRGRLMALNAARKYDPSRSRLQSHVLNHMQGLQRVSRQQSQLVRVPEQVLMDSQRLHHHTQELTDEMGREPSDAELSDSLGISMKRLAHVRRYQPGMTSGQVEAADPMSNGMAGVIPGDHEAQDLWTRIVYQDLAPLDQRIMELTLGLHGNQKLSNSEVAKRVGRSPGAITQRKMRIQQLLDQEQQYSPFVAH